MTAIAAAHVIVVMREWEKRDETCIHKIKYTGNWKWNFKTYKKVSENNKKFIQK